MGKITIKQFTGDILNSDAPIIAHQVNCLGVMGAGVAKCIRLKYPDIMKEYKRWCETYDSELLLGLIQFYHIGGNRYIVNCFAQNGTTHNGRATNYEAFYKCMEQLLNAVTRDENIEPRIAIPYKIGCGLGGADWNIIFAMIKAVFSQADNFTIELWSIDGFKN